MTPRADLLDEVKPPGKIKYVAAASGALLPVIGVGNAKVKGANGELVGLGNVLLVEGLSANLLSVRRLQKSKAEVTFGPTSCRAKLGKKVLWSLEEETSCIKDLWQLPIIPWNGKTPTAATAATAKATAGGDATAPTDGVLEAVKKVQQQQTHGEEWKQQQQKLPSTPLIVEADEVQQPSRQVEVAVSEEEMSGVTEEGGAAEVEQQQQHESPPRVPHPPERPRRDVRPPVRLTYGGRGKPNVVQAGSVVEQIEEDEIAHCYWAPIPEYMALHHGAKEVVWLRRLLEELGVGQEKPTVVFCDNESAVKLAKNACLHGLTKHIRPKWHWVRRILDKEVRLEIVKTHQQAADIFTKRLAEADHWKGMKLAGMSVH
ncbi:hypothetical protein CLOM_g23956 [Closterium sp. NIES-68]|nr:hypothetical protein CLOM_g23956 [Closterium sp. NIES-68]